MIARVGIQKGEDLATQGGVDYLVYAWQRKVILWTCFVEASIINAHSPFLSLLFNKNRIGKPVRVEYLSDELSYQEFGDLLAYGPYASSHQSDTTLFRSAKQCCMHLW